MALVVFLASGGHTIYEHLCKTSQESCELSNTISFIEDNHDDKECCQEFSSSHELKEDCCDDKTEFAIQEQVQISVDQFLFQGIAILPQKVLFPFVEVFIPQQKQFSAYFNRPPPRFKKPLFIHYQSFIC